MRRLKIRGKTIAMREFIQKSRRLQLFREDRGEIIAKAEEYSIVKEDNSTFRQTSSKKEEECQIEELVMTKNQITEEKEDNNDLGKKIDRHQISQQRKLKSYAL